MDDALNITCLPDDPQTLKAMVLTLTQERDAATQERDAATQERDAATQERDAATKRQEQAELKSQQLELEKLRLQHQLDQLKKRYYGPRADNLDVGQLLMEFAVALEKRPVNPQDLPAEAAAAVAADVAQQAAVRRIKRGRRNIAALDKLPVVRRVYDLSEEEKHCDRGHPLVKIGETVTWQIEYFPGYFARIEQVQIKYGCTEHCEPNGDNPQITLAPKPPAPIDKGMAGPGLLAYLFTSKFADHLPWYRQESILQRNGLEIDRSTMSVWAGDAADLIKPLYELMIDRLLHSHVIGTDDTIMPMLAAEKTRQARMWIYQGDDLHPYNIFDFTLSRSRDGPAKFLKNHGFDKLAAGSQVLLADAYGGYEGVCIEREMIQAGCWSHARRKFVDTQKLAPPIAVEALGLIGQLFALEERAKPLSCADRLALRQAYSAAVLEQLHGKLLAWKQQLVPRHPMAEAIGYVLNQWGPLTAFLSDGAIPIHNNLAEQQMKRIALGRKNYLFVGNERGGRTAAILSSITSTCRRHEIDPQLYLTQLLANLPATPMSQLEQWLPDVWKRRHDSGVVADAQANT
jgi:transposase